MKRTTTTWVLGALLALTGSAGAQDVPAAGEERTKTQATGTTHTGGSGGHETVRKEDVSTWTMDIDGKEWEVHPRTPNYEGTTGLFHMASAYTLPRKKWSFSLFRDNLDRDPKDEDLSTHGLTLGYGVADHFELFASFGLQQRNDVDALFQPGFYNDMPFARTPWETGFGDIKIGGKLKFLDDYHGDAVGLAAKAYVKIPTADEDEGLGTGKASFGGDLILSKTLGYKADIHAQVGVQFNGDPDAVNIGNAFKWGLGLNLPACKIVQLQAEVLGTRFFGDDDFEQTNPVDLVVGPVVWIRPGIFIRPAISWNLNFDDRGLDSSSKSWTGRHISIGYHPGTACREVFVPPPPPPPPANRNPTVVCEAEKATVTPGESVRMRATASDADGDALTYTWTTTAGRIEGTGAQITLNTTGVAAGTTITCTVRVSDGRGGTAESSCTVRLAAPAAPQTVTCISGGFPRNLARLNNVDKACLDDVASRMKTDPRSRVIIIGHADSTEKTPDVIARKRAEAVKDYLVKQRGVEEARITVRSAGATKPADTGTTAAARDRNRRVELIFVPEGATAPED